MALSIILDGIFIIILFFVLSIGIYIKFSQAEGCVFPHVDIGAENKVGKKGAEVSLKDSIAHDASHVYYSLLSGGMPSKIVPEEIRVELLNGLAFFYQLIKFNFQRAGSVEFGEQEYPPQKHSYNIVKLKGFGLKVASVKNYPQGA